MARQHPNQEEQLLVTCWKQVGLQQMDTRGECHGVGGRTTTLIWVDEHWRTKDSGMMSFDEVVLSFLAMNSNKFQVSFAKECRVLGLGSLLCATRNHHIEI